MSNKRGRISKAEWHAIKVAAGRALAEPPMPPVEEARGPMIFRYIRCSHEDSAKSGLGLGDQVTRADHYCALLTAERDGLTVYPEVITDPAVSGWKKRLIARPGGGRLNTMLRRGDHVVFAKLDRAFRSSKDFLITMDDWHGRGIYMHFADLKLDGSTALGKLMLTVMAAMAEWEAHNGSERQKSIKAFLASQSRPCGKYTPMGYRRERRNEKVFLVPDPKVQRWMREAYRLRWEKHIRSTAAIATEIERQLASEEGRKPMPDGLRTMPQWWIAKAIAAQERYMHAASLGLPPYAPKSMVKAAEEAAKTTRRRA